MGQMIDGEWKTEDDMHDEEGSFERSETTFRGWIRADGSTSFEPEPGRYHLYVSLACPWAHRTLIMRTLKGLEEAISVSIVDPYMGEDGWEFSRGPGCIPDSVNGAGYLREIYKKADPHYTGRVTVPVLWDKRRETIVNNESAEIMRMFDVEWDAHARNDVCFYPEQHRETIDRVIEEIFQPINNGVYRAGFAASQEAYEEAVRELFGALDRWEDVLSEQRYLCGSVLTEADWCMFTTLFRFDPVYHTHFQCNLRRIVDYPHLWNYLRELYQIPGVSETCNLEHIKQHYYRSHKSVNPKRIVPIGPEIDYEKPHDRDRLEGRIQRGPCGV